MICTDRFEFLARTITKSLGVPNLSLVIISHPIGGLSPEEVQEKADNVIEDIVIRMLE